MGTPSDWPSTRETLIGRLQEQTGGPPWDLFVEVYGPLLYRFCRRRGVQDADARDVTQNVFLAVRRGIKRFTYDPARAKFRSWLGTIAAREIIRYQREAERAGEPNAAATDGAVQPLENDAAWIVEFNSHVCDAALERIRPDMEELTWRAFELLWKQDLKPGEVAQRLKKPIDWVYQAKYRVLRRLEKEIRFLTADIPSFSKD
jgi:RNA polymerase sigma factor (sigma-70 family)